MSAKFRIIKSKYNNYVIQRRLFWWWTSLVWNKRDSSYDYFCSATIDGVIEGYKESRIKQKTLVVKFFELDDM